MNQTEIAKAAYSVIINSGFASFPFELTKLNSKSLRIISFQKYSKLSGIPAEYLTDGFYLADGYCVKNVKGLNLILYNELTSSERTSFTLAHELGHIFLNHSKHGFTEEKEADFFASELLMPDAAVNYLIKSGCRITADFIRDVFKVSHSAAKRKAFTAAAGKTVITSSDKQLCSVLSGYLRTKSPRLNRNYAENHNTLLAIESKIL